METLIDKKDFPIFKEYFGSDLVFKNNLWCDITHTEKVRVYINIDYNKYNTVSKIMEFLFWLGVIIGKDIQAAYEL